jgi:translation initiation factor 2 beta subunit (eIF-2beta)/eIF-5
MSVNIPRDVEDPFYRYKMPILVTKVEGRGNGIYTVLENLAAVGKALGRPPEHLLKYFATELSCASKTMSGRFILTGKHETLNWAIDKFIDGFVLCGKCKNPETDVAVKGKMKMVCRACGTATKPPDHKLTDYIEKHTGDEPVLKVKRRKHDDDEYVDDDDWAVPTDPESVNRRRCELLGVTGIAVFDGEGNDDDGDDGDNGKVLGLSEMVKPGENPMAAFREYFGRRPAVEVAVVEVRKWTELNKLSGSVVIKALFGTLFGEDVVKDFAVKVGYLRNFVVNMDDQKTVMFCIEKLCQELSNAKRVKDILNGFWFERIIDEEMIFKWYQNPPKTENAEHIRELSREFVDWLRTAEEDE